MEEENNTLHLKINRLDSNEYDSIIEINGRKNVNDLKEYIGGLYEIRSSEMILRRGNRLGQELKDGLITLQKQNLVDYGQICVQKGEPCGLG